MGAAPAIVRRHPLARTWNHSRIIRFLLGSIVIFCVNFCVLYHAFHVPLRMVTEPVWNRSPKTNGWWNDYVDRIAQPFHPWNGTQWCHIDKSQAMRIQQPAHTIHRLDHRSHRQQLKGIMLTKVHKAASTTSASVTLRIAHRVAHRLAVHETMSPYVTPMCHSHFYHEFSQNNQHSNRDPLQSFLWGTVRLPDARSESAFYYYVPEQDYRNESKHMEFLELSKSHQLRLLRRRNENLVLHHGNLFSNPKPWSENDGGGVVFGEGMNRSLGFPENSIIQLDPETLAFEHIQKEILQFYNFIAVTERWMESMAVLTLLLPQVQYSDVIALRVKERGTFVSHLDHCKYIPTTTTPTLSPLLQSYLAGTFQNTNPDYLLYAAVNRSLDLTIEMLGKRRVDEAVRQIQYLQNLAEEKCQEETVLPCSATGERQPRAIKNCYVRDFGCGHECLDRVLERNQ